MFTPDQIAAANKTNLETMMTIANTTFASIERMATLNLDTARSVMEENLSNVKTLMAAKDVQELTSLQMALAKPMLEKAVAYARSAYEIQAQTQEELSRLVETQVSELNKSLSATLDKAAKAAPAGSDVAVTAMKSAIAAANSAYDSVNRAVKQVSEMTEANVIAATNATVKAVNASAKTTKKASA